MFDVGFWELLVIAAVLLLVLGPERLPEVAKQAAFWVRKMRQGMFKMRNEMRNELGGDPLEGLKEARREVSNFKNDMKQFGRDLADSHEINDLKSSVDDAARAVSDLESEMVGEALSESEPSSKAVTKKKTAKKTTTKKKTSRKKSTTKKKTAKKASKKAATKT